jgi:hypothetical protein
VSSATPEIADLRIRLEANSAAVAATQVALEENLQLRQEVASLRADLVQVRQLHQQELSVHEAAITELRSANKDLQTTTETVRALQAQVNKLGGGGTTIIKGTDIKK